MNFRLIHLSLLLSVLLVSGLSYELSAEPVSLFGHEFRSHDTAITFSGEEIEDVDALTEALRQFDNLQTVDLGTYRLDARTAPMLDAAFPFVTFRYQTYVELGTMRIPTEETVLDLENCDCRDPEQIAEIIPYLPQLEVIDFGTNPIDAEQKEQLQTAYPDVGIRAVAVHDVYGRRIREDAEALDLRTSQIDGNLAQKLALFPHLRTVDLRGHSFTTAEQLLLKGRFPNVEFGWTVTLYGKEFDSHTDAIDLSGIELQDTNEVERAIVLFPRCTSLDMCDCGIGNEEMAALRERLRKRGIETVWRLSIGMWTLKTDDVSFSVLVATQDECRWIGDEDLEVLKYTVDLKALDLGHQSVTDVTAIAKYCPNLRILILADDAVEDITPLGELKHLHYLELFWRNTYSDLSPLVNCRELVDLNVSYAYSVTDFSALHELPMLERLWIEHTSISEEELAELRELYPRCTIVSEGEGSVDKGWRTHPRYYEMLRMYWNPRYESEAFFRYDGITDPADLSSEPKES